MKKALKEENLEISYLHMSMESDKATGCLTKECSEKYSKELAHEAWKKLKNIYAKTDIFLTTKLRQDIHSLKLKEEGDSTDFSENIATIQIKSKKITDDKILEKEIC